MKLFTSLITLVVSLNLSAQNFEPYSVHLDHPNQHLAPCLEGLTLMFDYSMNSYAIPLNHGTTVNLPVSSDIAPPTTSNMRVNTTPMSYYPSQWHHDSNPIVICCECDAYNVYVFVDSVMKTVWITMTRVPHLACAGPGCNNQGD